MRTATAFTAFIWVFLLLVPVRTASAQAQDPIPAGPEVDLDLIVEGLTSPVTLAEPPDGSGRLFVVDQIGQVWILMPDGILLQEPFLDIQDRLVELDPAYDERGLLGLAFHPDYVSNGRFFVYYSAPLRPEAPAGFDHTSHLSEFTVSGDPNLADPASERILLQVDQPQSNHNAGTLAFGPDGFLYISLGDGGGANDVGLGHVDDWYEENAGGNGQDTEENLLGSILRIDVDGGDPYGIPPDNPFGDEQYAYGFRNPYRFSFDMGGELGLLSQDAGQELFEEVSVVTKGGNYGWNVKEGTHCFDAEDPENPPADCPDAVESGPREGDPLVDPVIEFLNAKQEGGLGLVVVGGYVYRGGQLPQLDGRYIFGAFSRGEEELAGGGGEEHEIHFPGRIFVAEPQEEGLWPLEELQVANNPGGDFQHFVLGFGQDSNGEVYVLTTDELGPIGNTGKVYRLAPPTPDQETYVAHLAGYNELTENPFGPPEEGFPPFTVQTPASGSVIATLEGTTLSLIGWFSDLSADFTASHIHEAPAGVNGPVVRPLSPTLDGDQRGGIFDQSVPLSAELIDALREGNLYVNVHTTAHPPGEIRGQLLLSPNSPPAAVLEVSPAEDFSFDFVNEGDPSELAIVFEWDAVEDPDGDRVIYQLEFSRAEDFTTIFASLITVLEGEVLTEFAAEVGDIEAVLAELGVEVGQQVTLFGRVNSSDGSLRRLGETLTFNVTRGVVGPAEDTTDPECEIMAVNPGPPMSLDVRVQDTGSGLSTINVLQEQNATVNVPDFDVGTTDAVIVNAVKTDQSQRAFFMLEAVDVAGNTTTCDPVVTTVSAEVPEVFSLEQNYPNPFNPSTTIQFKLAEETQVLLEIYDVMGRKVATLIKEAMQPGVYEAVWDGRNDAGLPVAGGVYIYHLNAGSFEHSKTMTLLK